MATTPEKSQHVEKVLPQEGASPPAYHKPTLQEFGKIRHLTQANPGQGPDGNFPDGVDDSAS